MHGPSLELFLKLGVHPIAWAHCPKAPHSFPPFDMACTQTACTQMASSADPVACAPLVPRLSHSACPTLNSYARFTHSSHTLHTRCTHAAHMLHTRLIGMAFALQADPDDPVAWANSVMSAPPALMLPSPEEAGECIILS